MGLTGYNYRVAKYPDSGVPDLLSHEAIRRKP